VTYQDLLYERRVWKFAWNQNRKYSLGMNEDELRSEIWCCLAWVYDSIEKGKVSFSWSDEEQVMKYFMAAVRNRFLDIVRERRNVNSYDDEVWDRISFYEYVRNSQRKKISSVINTMEDERIYKYVVRYCRNLSDVETKLRRVYRKFGVRGLQLIYHIKSVLENLEIIRYRREDNMKKFKGLHRREVEWLCHLLSKDTGKEITPESLTKGMVLEFGKKLDSTFGRRCVKWASVDLAIDESNDCFGSPDPDDKDCKGCADFDNCMRCHEWLISKEPEVKKVIEESEEKIKQVTKVKEKVKEEKSKEEDDLAGIVGKTVGVNMCWISRGKLNLYLSKDNFTELSKLTKLEVRKELKNNRMKTVLTKEQYEAPKVKKWLQKVFQGKK